MNDESSPNTAVAPDRQSLGDGGEMDSHSLTIDGTLAGLQTGQIVCIVHNNQDFPFIPGPHTIVSSDPPALAPPAGQQDLFAQTNWGAEYDPSSCAHLSQTEGFVSWLHIPETRRYDVIFTAGITSAVPGSSLSVKVCKNGFNVRTDAIASDIRSVANPGENWPRAERLAVLLQRGDWLVWSNWGSASFTCTAHLFNIPTQIMLRAAAE